MDPRRRDLAELGDNALWLPDLEPVDEMGVVQAFRACEKIASDVVQTFRSARHGRPEGLHYSDFFTGASALRLHGPGKSGPYDRNVEAPEQA